MRKSRCIVVDVGIKENYLRFINKSKTKLNYIKKELDNATTIKEDVYSKLYPRRGSIKQELRINLDIYPEFKDKVISEDRSIFKIVYKLFRYNTNINDRTNIILLYKYLTSLDSEDKYKKGFEYYTKLSNMTISKYRDYLFTYFNAVHRELLFGRGYRFPNNFCTIYISKFIKLKNSFVLDFKETRKRKQEIINAGGKIFNKDEASWYKDHNLEYDAVDYRVYRDKPIGYKLKCKDCKVANRMEVIFKCSNYINSKYKNMTYEDIANNVCSNIDDICNLQVSLLAKLHILLLKYPGLAIKYEIE